MMSFNVQASTSTVAIVGGVSFSETTLSKANAEISGSGTADIVTVTASKVMHLVGWTLSGGTAATTGYATLKDSDGNVVDKIRIQASSCNSTQKVFTSAAITLAAGKKLQVSSDSGTLTGNATVYYYEVAA